FVDKMADLRKLDARRRQLGMSRSVLARRSKISVPTVHRILTGKEESPSVQTVEALAAALGMSVQLVETVDAERLRDAPARRRAARMVSMVQGTMGLEAQAIDASEIELLKRRNAHRLLAGPNRRLWDE